MWMKQVFPNLFILFKMLRYAEFDGSPVPFKGVFTCINFL